MTVARVAWRVLHLLLFGRLPGLREGLFNGLPGDRPMRCGPDRFPLMQDDNLRRLMPDLGALADMPGYVGSAGDIHQGYRVRQRFNLPVCPPTDWAVGIIVEQDDGLLVRIGDHLVNRFCAGNGGEVCRQNVTSLFYQIYRPTERFFAHCIPCRDGTA